jgi:hypothetical protein
MEKRLFNNRNGGFKLSKKYYSSEALFETSIFSDYDIFEFLKCYFFSNRFHNCTNFVKQIRIPLLNFVLRYYQRNINHGENN